MTQKQAIPLPIVGSTKFGRYPKISVEQTFNMFISDNALVSFPGYKLVKSILNKSQGRQIFASTRWQKMIAVIGNGVYVLDKTLNFSLLFGINTSVGDVFIDENNNFQIAICDKKDIWIYNWKTNVTTKANINFKPGYITYQDTYFISPNIDTFQNVAPPTPSDQNSTWRLSESGDGTSWPYDAQHQGTLQTKPDYAVATIRVPGRENLLFVMGKTVVEPWYDVGANLFPYQRSTTTSIDYGCVNPATVDSNDEIVAWLGFNEKSGYAILYSNGGDFKQISTDGINYKLGQLKNPTACFGFLFKQYGHVLYQITFYDPDDNFTYIYDFETQAFFTLTDENQNHHIAKSVAFFNNTYYFVSTKDGNIYELSNKYNSYDYGVGQQFEIPRYRILPSIRLKDSSYFRIDSIVIISEQGDDPDITYPCNGVISTEEGLKIITEHYNPICVTGELPPYMPKLAIALSKDGGETFGSFRKENFKKIGNRQNRIIFYQLGVTNDLTIMFNFNTYWRVVIISSEMMVGLREV